MKIEDLVRDNVKKLTQFSSARAEFTGSAEVFLDANENPFESDHNRYPDPRHSELRDLIGTWRNIDANKIILGNGSDELIDMIIRVFCVPGQDIIRIISPTFGMYEVCAAVNDVTLETVALDVAFQLDVEACLQQQTDRHKILFLCSPNNPTGNDLNRTDIETILKSWNGIVVVDEAYIDFSDQESLLNEIDENSNLIVLQTFSKALGAAGLRIGICFSNQEVIDYLYKVKPPYNIGTTTQKHAIELLSNYSKFQSQIETIVEQRENIISALSAISGVKRIYPSQSNFLLLQMEHHMDAKTFLQEGGIIVRDRSKLPGCRECLRVTIGLASENQRLINRIIEFYKK